jgi:hypothetical protein
MNLDLICGALEATERDFQIHNPLKGRVSILSRSKKLDAKEISKYYPKPRQEEVYYFVSGFLGERCYVPLITRIQAAFNTNVWSRLGAYKKIYTMGLKARRDYDARI